MSFKIYPRRWGVPSLYTTTLPSTRVWWHLTFPNPDSTMNRNVKRNIEMELKFKKTFIKFIDLDVNNYLNFLAHSGELFPHFSFLKAYTSIYSNKLMNPLKAVFIIIRKSFLRLVWCTLSSSLHPTFQFFNFSLSPITPITHTIHYFGKMLWYRLSLPQISSRMLRANIQLTSVKFEINKTSN